MSKFKKETTKRIWNCLYREEDLKSYKRDLNAIEHAGILMGDELPEECIWGTTRKDVIMKDRNNDIFRDMRNEDKMERHINVFKKYQDHHKTNPFIFLIAIFFHYEAKENL